MKQAKRLVGILLAMIMTLAAASVPAMAGTVSNPCTVTFESLFASVYAEGVTATTFEGYQLLSLDAQLKDENCHEDGNHESTCYNYAYDFDTLGDENSSKYKEILLKAANDLRGSSESPLKDRDGLLNYLKDLNDTQTRSFADAVYQAIKTAGLAPDATSVDYPSLQVDQGYWLFADISTYEPGATNTVKSLVLLDTAGNPTVTVTPKQNIPTVDKGISDTNSNYGEHTDVGIGDTVYFEIVGTLPDYLPYYETYKYVFHDTLSDGLTFDKGSVKVTIDGKDVTEELDVNAANENALTVGFDNIKAVTGVTVSSNSKVVLTYTATLNQNAVIGNPGNPNKVYLEYSNDPYDETGATTGKTPEDIVVAFTFQLDVTKVEQGNEGNKLQGAEFVLLNSDKTKVAKVSGGKIVEWVDDSSIVKESDGTYPADYTLTSDANGLFKVAGLDVGTYYLKETKAPAGYNLLKDPVKITISSTYESGKPDTIKTLTITADGGSEVPGDPATGTVEITIKNSTGAELPSTGGMGTTLFYAAGGVLVLGAAVLLITRKRMSSKG